MEMGYIMKKTMINDKVFIPMIVIFVMFGLSLSILSSIRYKNNQQILLEEYLQHVEKCKSLKEEEIEGQAEWCQKVLEDDLSAFDTNAYDGYENYASEYLRKYLNEFILIAIIVIGSSYYITKYLRNRIILNDITREKCKRIIKKLFFSAWKYALLVPLMLLTIYFIIFLNVDNFQFSESISDTSMFVGTIFENNIILLFLAILFKAFILSLFYININLIISRKEHNYILSVIKTYLFIVGIEIFFELIFSNVIDKLFSFEYGLLFNVINIYTYPYVENGLTQIFILLGILLISFIPVFMIYRNKEKLIIDSEKNDNKEDV